MNGVPTRRMRRDSSSRRARACVAAAVAAVLLPVHPASAAWSRSANGETDETAVTAPRRLPAPTLQPSGSWWSGTASWVGGAALSATTLATDTVSAAVGAATVPIAAVGTRLSEASTALDQFGWEVAYVFGINRTPVEQVHVADPLTSIALAGTGLPSDESPAAIPPSQGGASAGPAGGAPLVKAAAPPVEVQPPVQRPAAPPPATVQEPAPPPAAETRLLAELATDKPQRRPDGSYFVPKPLQRMFDIRTLKANSAETPLTTRLPGRIVPDPNAHGDVEASLLGRIEPPKTGLPVLGEVVKKGQILGYVTPAIGVVDRSQVRREVARLTNEIRITAEGLEMLKQFWFVPFRDGKVLQAEVRLDGLRRERAALLPMLQTQEVLRAAVDGVISATTAINGRIVHPGEKIFEIVNPHQLWIEAVAADPEIARGASLVQSAIATTPEGEALDLTFIGSGLALQQQSVPLMFRIDDPIDGLRVGRPVTVTVRNTSKLRQGIPIPREAVVTDSGGSEQVWEMVGPEGFQPHTVKTESMDGRNVLILAGVEPGARIVTRGARLLSQFQ